MSEVAKNIVAGIFLILVLFWLLNPSSKAPDVIKAISSGTVGTIQALQGYSPKSGGRAYGTQVA